MLSGGLGSPRWLWLLCGYVKKPCLLHYAHSSFLNRESFGSVADAFLAIVLCIRISFLFLRGLYDVSMVGVSSNQCPVLLCADPNRQASELHPSSCCDPSPDHKRVNCIYNVLGALPLRRIVRSSTSPPSLDLYHNCASWPDLFLSYKKKPLLIQYPDLNLRLPRHPKPRHHQTRNRSLAPRCLRREFRQHVLAPSAIASDSRERARGPCFCHYSQIMGLGRGYFPTHASR